LSAHPLIELRAGAYRAKLAPAAGARIATLDWIGEGVHPLLVAWDRGAFDAHAWPKAGAFPMLPFANRLPPGGFPWKGDTVRPQPGPEGFAVHGVAHRKPWKMLTADGQHAVIELVHEAGEEGWPWSWSARQDVRLTADGLTVRLALRNEGTEPMPFGLGWHPYHPVHAAIAPQHLRFTAAARRELDRQGRTAGEDREPCFEMRRGETAAFRQWDGSAVLQAADSGAILVSTEGVDGLVLHRPSSGDYLCIEPVATMPGQLGRDTGADAPSVLRSGQERMLSWTCAFRPGH
jgi:aldose 1-epimerase